MPATILALPPDRWSHLIPVQAVDLDRKLAPPQERRSRLPVGTSYGVTGCAQVTLGKRDLLDHSAIKVGPCHTGDMEHQTYSLRWLSRCSDGN